MAFIFSWDVSLLSKPWELIGKLGRENIEIVRAHNQSTGGCAISNSPDQSLTGYKLKYYKCWERVQLQYFKFLDRSLTTAAKNWIEKELISNVEGHGRIRKVNSFDHNYFL